MSIRSKCEHCGGDTVDGCNVCGAPVCCPRCCAETTREILAEMAADNRPIERPEYEWPVIEESSE